MVNIWVFCLQTLTVSLCAGLLWIVKRLLEDKLSPRWQYGIWVLLALRCLIPVSIHRDILLPLGLWLETAKSFAESGLNSAFSAVFTPISAAHIFPAPAGMPQSITDWLLVVYAAGAIGFALYYLVSYILLRLRLNRGEASSPEVTEVMARVCQQYALKPCTIVAVPGLESAFVCGIFRPVLAVPAGEMVDEKVILHELLHLKYWDIPQNIFCAFLRCLHWCNPWMHYIFNQIGNDMESLCDQRVLERLEGEERRDYGMILLAMASRRYGRRPGTSSISNGQKNISRRISAIARFKKYPRGMALVSVCIGLVLVAPLLLGSVAVVDKDLFWPNDSSGQMTAFAAARVQRCSTMAGAIDTYAKGILQNNGFYIAVASPISSHENLMKEIPDNWYWNGGDGAEHINTDGDYTIYDLQSNSDGSYSAYLTFPVSDFEGSSLEDWPTDINGVPIQAGTLVIPLRLFQENGSWVVTESGPRIKAHIRHDQIQYYGEDMPWLAQKTAIGWSGTVTVSHRGTYTIDNTVSTDNIFGWTSFDSTLKPDAEFSHGYLSYQITYECNLPEDQLPKQKVGMRIWRLDTMERLEELQTSKDVPHLGEEYQSVTSSSTDGSSYTLKWVKDGWDRTIQSGGGRGYGSSAVDIDDLPVPPEGYLIQIVFDGVIIDEIVIEVNIP